MRPPCPSRRPPAARRSLVVTVPLKAVPELPAGFLDGAAEGFAVIDTGNYYPRQRDGRIAAIEDGLTESRWTERQIGHPVIKAFNGTYAQDILDKPRPRGAEDRVALPVSGDDEAAKKVVRNLIDELGFDTVDNGGQDESWRQQPGTPVYGNRGGVEQIREALAAAFTRAHGRVPRLTCADEGEDQGPDRLRYGFAHSRSASSLSKSATFLSRGEDVYWWIAHFALMRGLPALT
ncbi:hypothetical protein SALBM135S_06160 [Streptomyces alboniger]